MDFISIDFETANNSRISACAIGVAIVRDNVIVRSYKSFIKPPVTEKFAATHTAIHGITKHDVEGAKSFREIWDDGLRDDLLGSLVVCHNASMDISVLCQLASHYKLDDFKIDHVDTMEIAKKNGLPPRLIDLANSYGIEFSDSHDAQEDAEVCAKLLIAIRGGGIAIYDYKKSSVASVPSKGAFRSKVLDSDELKDQRKIIRGNRINAKDLESFVISGKGFLVTGEFSEDRDTIHQRIVDHGGLIKASISSKLDYMVVGEGAGWSKIRKVEELNLSGKASIKILNEIDFFDVLDTLDSSKTG